MHRNFKHDIGDVTDSVRRLFMSGPLFLCQHTCFFFHVDMSLFDVVQLNDLRRLDNGPDNLEC